MKAKQYTIRNIPPKVDQYLRKRARLTGKSLNRLIIEDLAARAGVSIDNPRSKNLAEQLDWFIGSGSIDDATLKALDEQDKLDKERTAREWHLDT